MLSDADRKKAADILMAAEKERKQAVQLSTTWPNIEIEDSYAISTEVANRKIAAGAKLIGHKVGLTSKAMQRSSMIDEPDYGHLLDDMMIADGAKIPHANFCRPRVEIELAFVLGTRLKGPGVGLTDVLRATEYVVPAIEIVDARLQDQRKIFDTVADNGAAAGIVVGGRPVGPMDVDLRWVGGIMYKNSEIEETGVAAGVLGHPALGVAWLANKLGLARRRAGARASGAGRLVHPRGVRRQGRHAARRLRRARRHRGAVRVELCCPGRGAASPSTRGEGAPPTGRVAKAGLGYDPARRAAHRCALRSARGCTREMGVPRGASADHLPSVGRSQRSACTFFIMSRST